MPSMHISNVFEKDFERILPVLSPPNLGYLPRENWRRLFCQATFAQHKSAPTRVGICLEDRDIVAGFLGLLEVNRTIRGQRVKLINVNSWVLLEQYRQLGMGMKLLNEVLNTPDAILTVLTPSPQSAKLFLTNGFCISSTNDVEIFADNRGGDANIELVDQDAQIMALLEGEQQAIFTAHNSFNCHSVVLTFQGLHHLFIVDKFDEGNQQKLRVHYFSINEVTRHQMAVLIDRLCYHFDVSSVLFNETDCCFEPLEKQHLRAKAAPYLLRNNTGMDLSSVPFMTLFSEALVLGV